MRTTLTLDDDIMALARTRAAEEGRPLKEIIGEALRLGLAVPPPAARPPFRLTTFTGQGLQPGVRLDDRDALYALLEEEARP
jgi:hypothetical protein